VFQCAVTKFKLSSTKFLNTLTAARKYQLLAVTNAEMFSGADTGIEE